LIKKFFTKLNLIFKDIKLAHSVFALPFALLSAFLAKQGIPGAREFFWILVAMVSARSGAMATNRLLDAEIDARNPRTKERALPSGKLKKTEMLAFILLSYALFIFSAYQLNWLCFILSPLAVAWISFYSLTKRFTRLSHFVLGTSLAMAPMGAWLAIKPRFELVPILLSLAVVFWVAGFDILYSFQDIEIDQKQGLFSIPSSLGIKKSLWLARALHFFSFVLLFGIYFLVKVHWLYLAGVGLAGVLFIYEHSLVKPDDLSRLDLAFFNINGWISVSIFVFGAISVVVAK